MTTTGAAQRGAGGASGARTLTITLPLPEPLMTANWRRRQRGWQVQQRHTRDQRHDAMLAAYAAMADDARSLARPFFGPGEVRADVAVYRRARQQVPDGNSEWEWCKPIWDGCQDAGVVEDDRQIVHGAMTWHPRDPDPRVVIVLTEMD